MKIQFPRDLRVIYAEFLTQPVRLILKVLGFILIQPQMTQKPVLRVKVGMRVRCANKASAEEFRRGQGIGQIPRKFAKSELCVSVAHAAEQ